MASTDLSTTAALILAAGSGRRFGQPKALVELDGVTLLQRAANVAAEAGIADVLAVLRPHVAPPAGVTAVVNPAPDRGMGSSVRVGLAAAAQLPPQIDRLVVLLVDMPRIAPEAVRRVAGAIAADGDLAAVAMARYADGQGHPTAFRRDQWEQIRAAVSDDDDRGARAYLTANQGRLAMADCADLATPGDIDTTDDLTCLSDEKPR